MTWPSAKDVHRHALQAIGHDVGSEVRLSEAQAGFGAPFEFGR
jgi:hypothetical protein